LKDHIRFIRAHRDLYEDTSSMNDVAVLYAEGPILRRTDGHLKYVALAQVLAESGVQFDVVYAGDGRFNPEELDRGALERYRTILVPEARDLGAAPAAALTSFARAGGEVVIFSEHSLDRTLAREADGDALLAFWRDYRDEDRQRIVESAGVPASARIGCSEPGVGVVRYASGDRQVFHLLDYRYDPLTDAVEPIKELRLRIPWQRADAVCTLLSLAGESALTTKVENDTLVVDVPTLDPYAVLVAAPGVHDR
jgi:hypothetical protein